jgi:uncharacterized OsmC-like protein
MVKMKTIGFEAKLDEGFKIEVRAGTHVMIVDQVKAGGGMDVGPRPLEYLLRRLPAALALSQESSPCRSASRLKAWI